MKKTIVILCSILLVFTPKISTTEAKETDNVRDSYACSVVLYGKVQFTNQLIHVPVGEKSFIMFMSMDLLDGSEVTVTIDNEVFDFDHSGKMNIVGFFGLYTESNDEDPYDGKTYIDLDGRALYATIEGETFEEVGDSYVPIIESLDNITYSLDTSPLELSDADLERLSYLSECQIVGLGEATHGTKEFFQLKHRIFKYLVEQHDFKIFAFECDMGESYYVDNYVTEGEGDIDDIMTNKMQFWTWRTEEVKSLLLWMKEFNEGKSDEDKIHFIGVDCQFLTYQADIILNYFNETNIPLSEDCIEFLHEIDQIGSNVIEYYETISQNKKTEIDQSADVLLAIFEEVKNELIAASSPFDYQVIKHLALNIKQVNDVLYGYAHYSPKNYRDQYMAENTLWTSDLFGENTKVALWAHNGHVGNWESYDSVGFHLKEALNDTYQIIGFAFSFGSFMARKINENYRLDVCYLTQEPKFGSINYVLHHAHDKNFILRESDIPADSALDTWISKSRNFLLIGATYGDDSYEWYYPIKCKEYFDILIYWDITTAAEPLIPTDGYPSCSTIEDFWNPPNCRNLCIPLTISLKEGRRSG